MKTNDSIIIERVKNGWIVRPAPNYATDRSVISMDEVMVFEMMATLQTFIRCQYPEE